MKGQGGWFGGGGGGNFGDYSYGGGGYDGYGFGGKGGGKESKGGGKGSIPCKFYLQGNCTRGTTCAFSHDVPQGQGGPTGGTGSQPGPGGKWFGGEDEDPELAEIQDAIAMQQLDDEKMRAEMAEMDEPPPNDNASEGSDPPLPPPATEKEIAEAQEIVKRAQDDLIERNKMKAKVKDANKTDLQAMINARLAKRWGQDVSLDTSMYRDAKMIGQEHLREADEA